MRKETIIYIGIDLHKETHTAVILDCWNQKLGEITFENKPAEFSKLTRKVSRFVTEEKTAVYGLENAYGYGRALAVCLIEKGLAVKDVNTALSYAQRKSVPMYQKSDSYDAEAVALVLINLLERLLDAIPDDKYWTLGQLVNRRDNINVHQQRLKNQLHEQLCMAYPSYKKFFEDIGRPTALYFFREYPSPVHLRGKTAEELAGELRPVSHNSCSIKRAERILELVRTDGDTSRDCQESRDAITSGLVRNLEHYRKQMDEIDRSIKTLLPSFGCTLMTIPGIDTSELFFSRKRQGYVSKTGNRRLQAIFYFMAIQMVQVSPSGTVRHPVFREYFLRKQEEGKNKPQALICIARRLVNIVYGMLKNHTEYRKPEIKAEEETV